MIVESVSATVVGSSAVHRSGGNHLMTSNVCPKITTGDLLLTKNQIAQCQLSNLNIKNQQGSMSLSVRDETIGQEISNIQIIFELFNDSMPKTCENFRRLCQGTVDKFGNMMHYKNSSIYEIVPNWILVGGDFKNNNGSGGQAALNDGLFEDEGFEAADYSQPGLLCMLSHGPNTNSSIFFITLKPAPWLKNLYVTFGRVTNGLDSLQRLAREVGTSTGEPKKSVKISSCKIF